MSGLNPIDEKTDAKLYKNSQLVIPTSMRFTTPKHGPIGTRKLQMLPPVSGSYSNANSDNIVRFKIPNDGLYDFRNGYLSFNLTITNATGTFVRVQNGVWTIFKQFILRSGSKELENMTEYGKMYSYLYEKLKDEDVSDVIGPSLYGYGTVAQRNAWGATANKKYAPPLFCGFFMAGLIPAGSFREQLELQLHLETDANKVLEHDSPTTPIITLTDIYLQPELIALSDVMMTKMSSAAQSGLSFSYKRFSHYTFSVTSAEMELSIPHVSAGIESVHAFFRDSSVVSNPLVFDKYTTMPRNGVIDYQGRINNSYFPPIPILCGPNQVQGYIEYLKWAHKYNVGGIFRNPPAISIDEYLANSFSMNLNLETHRGEGLINAMSTEQNGTNLYLKFRMSAPPPANTQLEVFVQTFMVLDVCGGKIS